MLPTRVVILWAAVALVAGACTESLSTTETLEVEVGPELVDCVGVGPMKCMVVDGNFFYDRIEGFEFEEGFEYRLRIERYEAYPGREPPQDASMYGYRLIEVLSKKPA